MKFIKGVCVYQVFPVREMIDFHNRCVIGISLILHMNFKLCMIQMFSFFAVFFSSCYSTRQFLLLGVQQFLFKF